MIKIKRRVEMDINKIYESEMVETTAGFRVPMSVYMYDNYYCDFTETQLFSFSNFINAGSYFPQIAQFVAVLTAILKGKTRFTDIMLYSVGYGISCTLLWFWGNFYKMPLLSSISCLIGGTVFRYFLHFIAIVIISLFVVKDWKVILFCAIGGVITTSIRMLFFGRLSKREYVDGVVRFVSEFKYKA